MANPKLSERLNTILPGEENKRIRQGILLAATEGKAEARTVKSEISQENRLKTGVLSVGSIEYTTDTNANIDLFAWVINFQVFQPGPLSKAVDAPHANFPRPEIFTGKDDNTIGYYPGSVDAEGNAQFPNVPEGEVLLRTITRYPNGDVEIDDSIPSASEWVSKTATALQTLASLLEFSKLARTSGAPQRVPNISLSGVLGISSSPALNDVYSTVEGVGDWSKLVTIDISGGQLRYFARLDFSGISPTNEKGEIWIQFQLDGAGDMVTNNLKVWGEINPAKLKMVRLDAVTYAIFVAHNEAAAFYKFRPIKQFGSSSVYTYHHQDGRNPLPEGDQFDFELYGDLSEIIADIEALETWLLDLENQVDDLSDEVLAISDQVDDHEDRIDDLEANALTPDELASIQAADSPTALNAFITVSALNSYAYVQEAPINGNHYARKDGVWTAFTPFTVAGTATDGHVVTSVAGVPTWVAPSGGGSSPWTIETKFIYRDSPVQIGKSDFTEGGSTNNVTFVVQSKFDTPFYRFIEFYNKVGTKLFYMQDDGRSEWSYAVGYGRTPLSNITLSVQSLGVSGAALFAYNNSGTVVFQIQNAYTRTDQPLGFYLNPLSNFSMTVKSQSAGGGSIALYTFAGALSAMVDDSMRWRSIGGAYFGRQAAPSGVQQVVVRGKTTTTSYTLYLEDSAGTANVRFVDNGNIDFLRLPTSDPLIAERLYKYDDGTRTYLCISEG